MNKIILADSQAIFRAGTAKVLAADERPSHRGAMRRPGAADARRHHLPRIRRGVCGIPAARYGPLPADAGCRRQPRHRHRRKLRGCQQLSQAGLPRCGLPQCHRPSLVDCVRRVAAGDTWAPPQLVVHDIARRRYGGHPRSRPPHAQGDAHRRAHRPGLQEPRDRRCASRPPSRSSRTTSAPSTTRPGSATAWNWRCSPSTTACWPPPPPKLAAGWKPKSSRPRPPWRKRRTGQGISNKKQQFSIKSATHGQKLQSKCSLFHRHDCPFSWWRVAARLEGVEYGQGTKRKSCRQPC